MKPKPFQEKSATAKKGLKKAAAPKLKKLNIPAGDLSLWQKKLLSWFEQNKRDLPWRQTKDPYKIWISEVLLQQTTVKAVVPYYKRFLNRFPDIDSLSQAQKKDVFSVWAGLGYYKRAENLLKAVKRLKKGFPKSFKELKLLDGFGPYTSRAVSSLAFEEPVGVLDGNVIRFLSRFHHLKLKSWTAEGRGAFQAMSDSWVKNQSSSQINQALMEIGSLICHAKNPSCGICPLSHDCLALKKSAAQSLPLKKPKKQIEFWQWRPLLIQKKGRWAFIQNQRLPFLKGRLILPGRGQKIKSPLKDFDFSHSITHYKIFVRASRPFQPPAGPFKWLFFNEIQKQNPSSLIKKVFETYQKSSSA